MNRTKAEQAAISRDGDTCLRCGRNLQGWPASLHHRKLKGRKVPPAEYDLVENLVVLCGTGTTGCHGWAHHNRAEAQQSGWIVNSWDDPASKYLLDLRNHMIILLSDGGMVVDSLPVLPDCEVPF